jgi:hypothetical protein
LWEKNNEKNYYSRDPEERDANWATLLALIPTTVELHASDAHQPPISQGRAACNLTLAPANPSAVRKPNGKQHDMVAKAASTAATGVALSMTFIRFSISKERS